MKILEAKYSGTKLDGLIAALMVKDGAERFLARVWSAVAIGVLVAILWGLSGLPALDSALRRDELLPVSDAVVFSRGR
jgi:hypothetical protein